MKSVMIFPLFLLSAAFLPAQTWQISNPQKTLTFEVSLTEGRLSYRLFDSKTIYIESSPLGLTTESASLSAGFSPVSEKRGTVTQNYRINHGKKSYCTNSGNTLSLIFEKQDGNRIGLEIQV